MGLLSAWLRLYCLLKAVVELNSYVLFAANPEDFRSIAKKIVPETLANKLAKLASDIPVQQHVLDENDETEDEYYYDSEEEEIDENSKEDSVQEGNVKDVKKPGEEMYVDEWKTKVNFNELVHRVKERLTKELTDKLKKQMTYTTQHVLNNGQIGIQNAKVKQIIDKKFNDHLNNYNTKKTYGYNNEYPKNIHQPKEHLKNEDLDYGNTKNKRLQKNIGHDYKIYRNNSNTYHAKYTQNKPLEMVTKKDQANDAYEFDTPKEKEYIDQGKPLNEWKHQDNLFHSEKEALINNMEERPRRKPGRDLNKKIKNPNISSKYPVSHTPEMKYAESEHSFEENVPKQSNTDQYVFKYADDDSNNDKSNANNENDNKDDKSLYDTFDLLTNKKNDSYEDYQIPKIDNKYASEETSTPITSSRQARHQRIAKIEKKSFKTDINQQQNNLQNLKTFNNNRQQRQTEENTKPVDDYTEAHISQEIKAKTESLWYNDDVDEKKEESKNPRGLSRGKEFISSLTPTQKTKHKGTMIPTREHFKMSSPNYYISLPTVAEKYDPNEPIPEKDREREVVKDFFNPPARINKKVKLI